MLFYGVEAHGHTRWGVPLRVLLLFRPTECARTTADVLHLFPKTRIIRVFLGQDSRCSMHKGTVDGMCAERCP
jgi:hypothetical protein